MLTPTYEERDHSEAEPSSDQQLLCHSSTVAESQDQEGSQHGDSGSASNAEPKPKRRCHKDTSHSSSVGTSPLLQTHSDPPTDRKSLKCDTCGETFRYNSCFNRHLRSHKEENQYCCETCKKIFRYNSVFLIHMRTHTGEKPYVCKTCGKAFKQSSHLDGHLRIHTGERPYVCKTCGKRFSQSSSLNVHLKIHTGDRPYCCQTCGKSFTRSTDLVVHMRGHTGERPYVCNPCGKGFRQSSDLKVHLRTHKELPQQHVCKKEEVLDDQQLWNQERNSSLDQEDPEPPQIKEEQEELCNTESQDQEGSQHGDSGSASHSSNVDNSPLSETQSKPPTAMMLIIINIELEDDTVTLVIL
uniref:zinc finger protein 239-like n=1 Tax=Monopterus albus TaxID=43700 RepID=UPI0009B33236|nr:zinc finger protein 239-like [Monopterus albus]